MIEFTQYTGYNFVLFPAFLILYLAIFFILPSPSGLNEASFQGQGQEDTKDLFSPMDAHYTVQSPCDN